MALKFEVPIGRGKRQWMMSTSFLLLQCYFRRHRAREDLVPGDLLAKTQTILGNKREKGQLCVQDLQGGADFYPLLIERA